jgi:hypothetical protein
MYPIEIGAVKAIAAGNAITDITWEAVAQINAQQIPSRIRVARPAYIPTSQTLLFKDLIVDPRAELPKFR